LSSFIEIEMKKTRRAENHSCHEKQTESLPVPYSHQSENLWHCDVPEKLENQRHHEKQQYDRETDENQSHASLLASRLIFGAGSL
jgi:hypothetical protein